MLHFHDEMNFLYHIVKGFLSVLDCQLLLALEQLLPHFREYKTFFFSPAHGYGLTDLYY